MTQLPDWPAMMSEEQAAAYCSLPVAAFRREVATGGLPAPVKLAKKDRWHRKDIDAALARIAGHVGDWRSESGLYGAAA